MTPLANALLLVGLGPLGARVVRDLDATATALATPGSPAHAVVAAVDVGSLTRLFLVRARQLLEAGAARTHGQARLDIVVVADAIQVGRDGLLTAMRNVSDVLADEFPVLFPPSAPPEQRSAWATLLLATPPLAQGTGGQEVAGILRALERGRAELRHPTFARLLLLPRQTTSGRLSDDGIQFALRAAVQTLFLSGCRDDDRIRPHLAHRSDDRWIGTLSVATAELPIARIRTYARWRLALSGLNTLLVQAEQPTTDPSRSEALRQQLDADALLDDFTSGEPARRVRERAARISGAEDHLPESFSVSLTERPNDVRARFRVLFEPIAKPWSRRIDPTTDPDHHAMLRLVDQVEADTLASVDRKVAALLDEQLEPATALRVLPSIEHALRQVVHTLDEELAHEPGPLPSPEPPPPPEDPTLDELERVIDGRPGLARTWRVLFALIIGLASMVSLGVSWLLLPPVAAISSTPTPPTSAEAWAAGVLFGLLVAAVWQVAVLWSWRTEAVATLRRRKQVLEEAWRRGGAGQERHQAEQLLQVRRRRTAHDLRRRLQAALERLGGLRAAIRQSTHVAIEQLGELRVRLADLPAQDDLSGLLGTDSPLQGALVEADALARHLDSSGLQRDPQRWASELLAATWPSQGGIADDLPCLDQHAVLAACDEALGSLDAASLLGSESAVTRRVHAFVASATPALGWGIRPRDAHGDPVRGQGREDVLIVAPTTLRSGVEGALADSPVHLVPCWTSAPAPWVSLLSVWDGFTAQDVIRGMG